MVNEALGRLRTMGAKDARRIKSGFHPYPVERDIVVLWSLYRGWSASVTADLIGGRYHMVARRRKHYRDHPDDLFKLPLMRQAVRYGRTIYECAFCGSVLMTTEGDARSHVAGHVLPAEVLAMHGMWNNGG